MCKQRVYNFSAGPSMLPQTVLEQINRDLMNYQHSGMSVMEMSHRSKQYMTIFQETKTLLRKVLNIPENYTILFLPGGATQQFSSIPLNLAQNKKTGYIITGLFSKKAMEEARKYTHVHVIYDGKDNHYQCIPTQNELDISNDLAYVHICENNTVYGTKWQEIINTGDIPLIADMSSCLLSEPVDIKRYGCIYAGTQKNMGIAGLCVLIIKKDMLKTNDLPIPSLMNYKLMLEKDSMYNTPPTFCIYVLGEVLKWIDKMGGLEVVKVKNQAKAQLLYDYLDSTDFYRTYSDKKNRSMMNVTFFCPTPQLEKRFLEQAENNGFMNLKGHREIGGLRASIYNAMPLTGVYELVQFMKQFEVENRCLHEN